MGVEREIRNCQRKRAYASEEEARYAALDRMADPNTPELRPYWCEWCEQWHLSSAPPRA